jgi:hypothetical protein
MRRRKDVEQVAPLGPQRRSASLATMGQQYGVDGRTSAGHDMMRVKLKGGWSRLFMP